MTKPTEMEERVAQAICCPRGICHPEAKTRSGGCVARLNYLHGARAAIEAMREPYQSDREREWKDQANMKEGDVHTAVLKRLFENQTDSRPKKSSMEGPARSQCMEIIRAFKRINE
tara:strand:- start:530 stop:877 length:348 start_codon:yes stop_codon:yes gene_type:complete